jgi:hypothetical protein
MKMAEEEILTEFTEFSRISEPEDFGTAKEAK